MTDPNPYRYSVVALFDAGVPETEQDARLAEIRSAWPAVAAGLFSTAQLWTWHSPDLDGYPEWVPWLPKNVHTAILAFGESPECGPITGQIIAAFLHAQGPACRVYSFQPPGLFEPLTAAAPVNPALPRGPWQWTSRACYAPGVQTAAGQH